MSKLENKTIMVTGATGLIGSNLVRRLMLIHGTKVIAVGRKIDRLETAFKDIHDTGRLILTTMNVADEINYETGFVDYIYHAAGPMEGKIIQNTPMSVIEPNIAGTINCLRFLKNQEEKYNKKGRMIIFSSVTVYANNTKEDLEVKESDTNSTVCLDVPSAAYSESKRMAEVIAKACVRQYGLDVVIARLSTVYGNTVFHPDTAFFQFIETALQNKDIVMNSSGIGRRDNIYIDDAVEGLITLAKFGQQGEAYNISSNGDLGNYAAVDEVAQIILDLTCGKVVCFRDGGKNTRKPGLKLNNDKLKSLGWSINTSLEDGIKKTITSINDK